MGMGLGNFIGGKGEAKQSGHRTANSPYSAETKNGGRYNARSI